MATEKQVPPLGLKPSVGMTSLVASDLDSNGRHYLESSEVGAL
jgi:hypothetical protein